jgi:hypothetical protein
MIAYEELDRALARWKARAKGIAVPETQGAPEPEDQATPLPIRAEELGSVPTAISPIPGDSTGEISADELESYEEAE